MSETLKRIAELKDLYRKRYVELDEGRQPILAALQPLRDKLDAEIETLPKAEEAALREQIKVLSAQLYVLDKERGDIARTLVDEDGKARLGIAS